MKRNCNIISRPNSNVPRSNLILTLSKNVTASYRKISCNKNFKKTKNFNVIKIRHSDEEKWNVILTLFPSVM